MIRKARNERPSYLDSNVNYSKVYASNRSKQSAIKPNYSAGFTALRIAAILGHLQVMQLLMDREAEIATGKRESYTPLLASAEEGHCEVVTLLLDRGANVNASSGTLIYQCAGIPYPRGTRNSSPVWLQGYDNAPPLHETALIAAAREGWPEVVAVLCNNGANLEARSKQGSSPLYEALRKCEEDDPSPEHQEIVSIIRREAGFRRPIGMFTRMGPSTSCKLALVAVARYRLSEGEKGEI
eukprot:gene33992-43919_t